MAKSFDPVSTVNFDCSMVHQRTALATGSENVRVWNAGPDAVFILFGRSTVTVTSSTGIPVPAGAVELFGVASGNTHIAGITASGTAKVYVTSGSGI